MERDNSAGVISSDFHQDIVPDKKSILDLELGTLLKQLSPKVKKIGTYLGRVATRASGSFNISTQKGLVQGISHKYCQIVHGKDGYQYAFL